MRRCGNCGEPCGRLLCRDCWRLALVTIVVSQVVHELAEALLAWLR